MRTSALLKTLLLVSLAMGLCALAVVTAAEGAGAPGHIVTTVDGAGDDVGLFSSATVGADSLPVISYYDDSNHDLKVAHCGDGACTSGITLMTVDSAGNVGSDTSISLGADGLPLIAYRDATNGDLKVAHCGDTACTSGNTITAIDTVGYVGSNTSVSIGVDGLPVIAYHDYFNDDLKVAHCGNAACTGGNSITTVDYAADLGPGTSVAIGADGLPLISYYDSHPNYDLKVVHCGNLACTVGNTLNTVDSAGDVGWYSSAAVGVDGLPVISYLDNTNITGDLKVTHCGDVACTSGNTTTTVDSAGYVGEYSSLTMGPDGLPFISYYNNTDNTTLYDGDLKVAHCGDSGCTSGNIVTTIDSAGDVGLTISATIAPDGLPLITYHDRTHHSLKAAHCDDAACSTNTVFTTVDSGIHDAGPFGYVGRYTSLAVGPGGLPIVSYSGGTNFADDSLKVVRCGDAACTSGNTITTVDGDGTRRLGPYKGISLTVGTDGLPLISYYSGDYFDGDLDVAHCGDLACTSGNTITTVASTASVGGSTSVALGADGLPLISYYDGSFFNGYLRLVHCGNIACSSGNTITPVEFISCCGYSSIRVGTDRLPLISYYEAYNANLNVFHCGNAACTAGNSITTVDSGGDVGMTSSVAMGSDGLPLISYYDGTNGDVKVAHCGNAACTAGNTRTIVDSTGDVGMITSVTIGEDGLPLISYHGSYPNYGLKVAHCGNLLCTAGNTLTTVDSGNEVGLYSSAAVGLDGLPVISYHDYNNGDLKLTHCANQYCAGPKSVDTDGDSIADESDPDDDNDGCSDLRENQILPASEVAGGRRSYHLFWDFFDVPIGAPPARDRVVSGGDIGAVVRRFGSYGDPGGDPLTPPQPAPAYHTAYDRGGMTPGDDPWDLLPPDGTISAGDIGAVVAQYGHSCA